MTDTTKQDTENWKQKYYDQLDQLDQKEKNWSDIESVLKKTVSRLCLAAEGSHKSVDQYINQIRSSTRDLIDHSHLDTILTALSHELARIEESKARPEQKITDALLLLLEPLKLPQSLQKKKASLLKSLGKASDKDSDKLLSELKKLIANALSAPRKTEGKPGLLERLLTRGAASKNDHIDADFSIHLMQNIPWPEGIRNRIDELIQTIKKDDASIDNNTFRQLDKILGQWDQSPETSEIDYYRTYMLSFIDQLDESEAINDDLISLKESTRKAQEKIELDKLCGDLAHLLSKTNPSDLHDRLRLDDEENDNTPSIQELLIRLLEQLSVPPDLNTAVEKMKERLKKETSPSTWHKLLKDVAQLINSIRSRLQKEKHEFENFLQEITNRLQEMDAFLSNESSQLQISRQQGEDFDNHVDNQVQEIHEDVTQATDLDELKELVQDRLETISRHIKNYRSSEQERSENAQKNIDDIQEKMVSLEEETVNLKQAIIQKNREAMIDVLTEIPNRLAYEKKVVEEIARWKRFEKPLTLAIWDVDLFKKVNDTYGHKAGDKVLKTIAQLLHERIRETDFLARFGGEEFVMLLPGTNAEETFKLVDQLRIKIQDCGFHYKDNDVNITASCGVSSFQGEDTLDTVFERADKALYEAKEKGRNRCIIASNS